MKVFSTVFSREERIYRGPELRPHFLLTELGLQGPGIGAFLGPCHVLTEHLVDWEDRLAHDRIEAKRMVHFIGEFFGIGLREGVALQRLFMSVCGDVLRELAPAASIRRDGDDLFLDGERVPRKLSVSIVTASSVSVLLHAGINIDAEGAPVPAAGLDQLGVAPETLVTRVLERFTAEVEGIHWACAKVRPV
jgi:hypothetical protein